MRAPLADVVPERSLCSVMYASVELDQWIAYFVRIGPLASDARQPTCSALPWFVVSETEIASPAARSSIFQSGLLSDSVPQTSVVGACTVTCVVSIVAP